MVAQKASLFLLKIGDGNTPENFVTLGGKQQTGFILRNNKVNVTNIDSGSWQQLADRAGVKSLIISGRGIFTDSVSEEIFCSYAFSSELNNYELSFGNDHKIKGLFLVTRYERAGEIEGEELFNITMESAGSVSYV